MKRRLALAAAVVLSAFTLTGCGNQPRPPAQTVIEHTHEDGSLTICVIRNHPPMNTPAHARFHCERVAP